jgi:hypothetical protein
MTPPQKAGVLSARWFDYNKTQSERSLKEFLLKNSFLFLSENSISYYPEK